MSNLNSLFDVLAGLPPHGKSALDYNFVQKTGENPILIEGMIAKVVNQAGVPALDALTSANIGNTIVPDYPWLIVEGMDMSDATTAGNMFALALKSGVIFKVASALAGVANPGDYVYSNAGVLTKVNAIQQAVGQVIESNATSGYIIVEAGGSGT